MIALALSVIAITPQSGRAIRKKRSWPVSGRDGIGC